jgi:hypothetical protein
MGVLLKLHFPRRRFGGGFFVGRPRFPHNRPRSPAARKGLTDTAKASIRDDLAILRDFECPEVDDDVYDRSTAQVVAFCRLHPRLIAREIDPNLRR